MADPKMTAKVHNKWFVIIWIMDDHTKKYYALYTDNNATLSHFPLGTLFKESRIEV